MAEGFRVDLAALTQAASGVSDTLDQLSQQAVGTIDGDKAAMGHDRLGGTVSDFCDRWQRGIENLAKDALAMVKRLDMAAQAYVKFEQENHQQLQAIVERADGPDPGVL